MALHTEICENCGIVIGKLEQACVFRDNVVCHHCYEKLYNKTHVKSNQKSRKSKITENTHHIEDTILIKKPTMFRSNPVSYVILVIFFVIGLFVFILPGLIFFIIWLVWFLKCMACKLIITNKRITLRYGIISNHTNEIRHCDIRNITVRQGLFQRMFGVGDIGISSAGQSDVEIEIKGITSPHKTAQIIRNLQN